MAHLQGFLLMDFLDRNLLVKAMSDRVGLWSSEAYIFWHMQADVQTLNFTHTPGANSFYMISDCLSLSLTM